MLCVSLYGPVRVAGCMLLMSMSKSSSAVAADLSALPSLRGGSSVLERNNQRSLKPEDQRIKKSKPVIENLPPTESPYPSFSPAPTGSPYPSLSPFPTESPPPSATTPVPSSSPSIRPSTHQPTKLPTGYPMLSPTPVPITTYPVGADPNSSPAEAPSDSSTSSPPLAIGPADISNSSGK